MAYFKDADELYHYLGGIFRQAENDPEVGPSLRNSGVTLRLEYHGPNAILTVEMLDKGITVHEGECDIKPDVRMQMSADDANKYWRGEYNVAVNLARGKVKAKGPVTKILKLIPATKPLFPKYKAMMADKDSAMVAR
jgi:putative sterol carrier protein